MSLKLHRNLNRKKVRNAMHEKDVKVESLAHLFVVRPDTHVNFTETTSADSAGDSVFIVHKTRSHG